MEVFLDLKEFEGEKDGALNNAMLQGKKFFGGLKKAFKMDKILKKKNTDNFSDD